MLYFGEAKWLFNFKMQQEKKRLNILLAMAPCQHSATCTISPEAINRITQTASTPRAKGRDRDGLKSLDKQMDNPNDRALTAVCADQVPGSA